MAGKPIHGLDGTPAYAAWKRMKSRCTWTKGKYYHLYGGKGIKVCDEWISDPVSFCKWAITNNYTEGMSLDRIDSNGNYEPSNCQWLTPEENSSKSAKRNNHGRNKHVKISEDDASEIAEAYSTGIFTAIEIARYFNVSKSCITSMIRTMRIDGADIPMFKRNQNTFKRI